MPIHVFIIYPFVYEDAYHYLLDVLSKSARFQFINHSIPVAATAVRKTSFEIRCDIRARIRRSDLVFLLADPIIDASHWIKFEIKLCRNTGLPILAVRSQGHCPQGYCPKKYCPQGNHSRPLPLLALGYADVILNPDLAEIEPCVIKYLCQKRQKLT